MSTLHLKTWQFITITFVFFALADGCKPTNEIAKSTPLQNAIKQWKFTPFTLFRDGDGVGTLITFGKGKEEAVIYDKSSCLADLPIKSMKSSVPKFSFEISRNMNAEAGASETVLKSLGANANLNGAFNLTKIKRVVIELDSTFETRLERGKVEEMLKKMTSASSNESEKNCFNKIIDKNNLLIERILGAKKIRYRFEGENNQNISITAELLDNINASGGYLSKFIGKSSIDVDYPIFLGYRVWRLNHKPGTADTPVEIKEITLSEVDDLKRTSGKKQ